MKFEVIEGHKDPELRSWINNLDDSQSLAIARHFGFDNKPYNVAPSVRSKFYDAVHHLCTFGRLRITKENNKIVIEAFDDSGEIIKLGEK